MDARRHRARALERHGRSLEGTSDAPDAMVQEQPVLASCYAASASDVQLLGASPGQKTSKLVQPVRLVPSPTEALAEVGGVNVHAKVVIDGRDRNRLERLCRYRTRPPLSQERLELHGDGRVRYRFKAAWKDGTHAVLLEPPDFIARLCALIPPPPFASLAMRTRNATPAPLSRRARGHSSVRAEVVPGREPPPAPPQLPLFAASDVSPLEPPPPPSRHPWDWLLKRLRRRRLLCPVPGCEGRMRVLEIPTTPGDIARILAPGARGPPPPRPPRHARLGQLSLAFG